MSNKITDITKRPLDGKFQVWKLTPAPECDSVIDIDNSPYIPKVWSVIGVFNYEHEAKEFEKSIQ
jgi:hypothetical protein